LKETTEEALLAEIESRVLREWQVLSGEFSGGDEIKQEYTTLRRRAARRIIGLGVLLESIESEEKPDEKLRAALEAASEHLRGPENDLASRVLAAAQLARSADEEAVGGLLRELAPPAAGSAPEDDSAPGDDSTSKDDSAPKDGSAPKDRAGQEGKAPEGKEAEKEKARAGTGGKPAGGQFALASLAIARSIEGPGRFTPLPEEQVGPGKAFLIYGEFTNFTTVPAAGSRHRASFSASLKLLGPKNDIIGVLDFLPVGRGDQTMVSPAEKLNFWARYRLPASLAPGTYRMVVTARDLLGGKTATAQLQFRVKG
jgi:hypothetical protein